MSDLVVGVSDIIRESDICEDRLFWIFCVLCIGVSDLKVGVSDVGSESLMCSEAACVRGGLTGLVWRSDRPQHSRAGCARAGRSDRPCEAV